METSGQDKQTIVILCGGGYGRVYRVVEGVEHRVGHIALFSSVLHGSVGVAFEI